VGGRLLGSLQYRLFCILIRSPRARPPLWAQAYPYAVSPVRCGGLNGCYCDPFQVRSSAQHGRGRHSLGRAFRSHSPALQYGGQQTVLAETSSFAFVRNLSPGRGACEVEGSMLIVLNRDAAAHPVKIPIRGATLEDCKVLLSALGNDKAKGGQRRVRDFVAARLRLPDLHPALSSARLGRRFDQHADAFKHVVHGTTATSGVRSNLGPATLLKRVRRTLRPRQHRICRFIVQKALPLRIPVQVPICFHGNVV
jgi:hypothetical protein